MIEQKMINKLKKKDESAFEYIYHETKRGVYAIIYAIVKNHLATDDIMQEVYMKMMKSIDQYEAHTNFNNWLLLIAKNQAIDYYRRKKKETLIQDEDYQPNLKSQDENPDEANRFNDMMDLLDDHLREIVLLRIVDNMKFKDIAKLQQKPLGTVIWEYNQALKKIRKYEGLS